MDQYSKVSANDSFEWGYGSYKALSGIVIKNNDKLVDRQTNSFTGYRNPYWKSQVRNNQNATTPASGVMYSRRYVTHHLEYYRSYIDRNTGLVYQDESIDWYGSRTMHSLVGFPGSPPQSVIDRVRNQCIRRFLDRCESIRSTFEAGQDLGEYKETLESVKHPMHSIQKYTLAYYAKLKKVRHKYRRNVPSLKKVLSDSYLEWHFGISPFVDDVASAIADLRRQRLPVYPVHARAHERYNGTAGIVPYSTIGFSSMPNTVYARYNSYGTYNVQYKGAIRSGVDPSGAIGLAQAYQLDLPHFLPTAWDLIPYSWLVDFFLNVGEVIRGLSFVTANLTWGCVTTVQDEYITCGDVYYDAPAVSPPSGTRLGTNRTITHTGSGYSLKRTFSRGILTGSDLVPTLTARLPHTMYQFADIGAILVSRFTKLVPFF